MVASRAGLFRAADVTLHEFSTIESTNGYACVLVDEAQFLTERQVEGLRAIATDSNIPVIAYGLKTDFRSRLFPGSQRLLELADDIEEIKTVCRFCERKATQNLRLIPATKQIVIGADDVYAPACFACFLSKAQDQDWFKQL